MSSGHDLVVALVGLGFLLLGLSFILWPPRK